MLTAKVICFGLTIVSEVLYSIAVTTQAWFRLPPDAFYGIWAVEFCDVLRCQIIPAIFTDQPAWYHVVQVSCLIGWLSLSIAMVLLFPSVSKLCNNKRLPRVSKVCFFAASMMFFNLVLFFTMLKLDSPKQWPQMSWSAMLAATACMLELCGGLILMHGS